MPRKRPRYVREGRWPRRQRKRLQRKLRSLERQEAFLAGIGATPWPLHLLRIEQANIRIALRMDLFQRGVIDPFVGEVYG